MTGQLELEPFDDTDISNKFLGEIELISLRFPISTNVNSCILIFWNSESENKIKIDFQRDSLDERIFDLSAIESSELNLNDFNFCKIEVNDKLGVINPNEKIVRVLWRI